MKNNCFNDHCGVCAYCLDLKIGDIVERVGDDGIMYEYEILSIDNDGECITIGSDEAIPSDAYIMADDCTFVKSGS